MTNKDSALSSYIPCRVCVPKQHERMLYEMISNAFPNGITFVDFREVLYGTGISEPLVLMYNAFYRNSGLQLNAELPYDLPAVQVKEFIDYIEFCTQGRIDWLVLAFVEIRDWVNFRRLSAVISADPILGDCTFIGEMTDLS